MHRLNHVSGLRRSRSLIVSLEWYVAAMAVAVTAEEVAIDACLFIERLFMG